ncbi:MAG: 30S ribosome-binding factor RbfA [Rhodobacteraceae bacterium]|nr:30S ribosome-binding factor RbfA [Paracoccaceae bacterium]
MARCRVSQNGRREHAPSQRQLRVAELIRRTLSDLLIQGAVPDPDLGQLSVTVGEVVMSSDLRLATIYVLPLGGGDSQTTIEMLAQQRAVLRRMIGKRVGLKFTPDLRFQPDTRFDQMETTRRILAQDRVRRDIEKPSSS